MRLLNIISVTCLVLSAPAIAAAQDKPAAPKPTATAKAAAVVNLNTATAAQLETLPGVGAKTAARILEHRQKTGGFKKIEELMNVKGIGEKAFLKIKSQITVSPAKSETSGEPKR